MKGSKAFSYELLLAEDASKICQWCWSVRSGDCEAKGRLMALAGGCARALPAAARPLQGAVSRQGAVASPWQRVPPGATWLQKQLCSLQISPVMQGPGQ